ncbi:MAG: Xaa-Pro peptidase family protein [Candidatus Acidiferrales bacterium]
MTVDAHSYASRIEQVRSALRAKRADALLVTQLPNVLYLSGFSGDSGYLLVEQGRTTLFTDGRFAIQAREEAPAAKLVLRRGSLAATVGAYLAKTKPVVAYSPSQLTLSTWQSLRKAAGAKVRWQAQEGLVEALRAIKSPAEVAAIREAGKLACDVMRDVIALIRPGVRELDLAAEIGYRIRRKGATGESFDSIVAAGPRSALPHARPTDRRIGKNELVVLDLGAILRRYCSDLTRTVFVGRAPARVKRWYRAVLEAHAAACEALRPGAQAQDVDRAARQVFDRCKLGRYFVHSTGHGLGLEIHEDPSLGRGQGTRIQMGSVVTIEPGVYIEGVGGIRIEDDAWVTGSGSELLTTLGRDLLEL